MSMTAPPVSNETQPASRRRTWIAIIVVALGLIIWTWHNHQSRPTDASITLVTSDRDDLACASEQSLGKYRCEFRAPGVPWPDPPAPADRLAPYYTVDRTMYLVPGLFEQPALAARYAAEEPRKLPRDQRPRFNAACKLKIVGELRNVQTRWLKNGEWGPQEQPPVAVASDCRIP